MRYVHSTIVLKSLVLLSSGEAFAAPVVLAGSELTSPPPFWAASFWGATPSLEMAFPFEVINGGPYVVDSLQVAVHRYDPPTGASTAEFALYTDNAGVPGAPFATFALNSIPTTPQVVTLIPQGINDVVLNSATPYWIVAKTSQGQLNWNLGDDAFGMVAYRSGGGDWTVLPFNNVSAFALLGSPVPEPSTFILAGIAGVALFVVGRRRVRRLRSVIG
jgi:hypothetical protein